LHQLVEVLEVDVDPHKLQAPVEHQQTALQAVPVGQDQEEMELQEEQVKPVPRTISLAHRLNTGAVAAAVPSTTVPTLSQYQQEPVAEATDVGLQPELQTRIPRRVNAVAVVALVVRATAAEWMVQQAAMA
jgi:hypothetical protein